MPQLDILSFFNQLFWFFLFYFCFYFFMLKTALPTIARTLKIRHKLLEKITSQTAHHDRTEKTLEKTINLLQNVNNFSKNLKTLKENQFSSFGNDLIYNQTKIQTLRKLFVEESIRINLIKYLLK